MTKLAPTTASGPLVSTGNTVEKAADALRKRRTRAEAQGRKRKTTKDVYEDVWTNFAAFLDYQETKTKADLLHWARRDYLPATGEARERAKRAWLNKLDTQLPDIDHHVVQAYKLALLNLPTPRGVGLAKATVLVRLAALSHLFKIAVREGAMTYNPASTDYVDRERTADARQKHVLSPEEVRTVLRHHAPQDAIAARNRMLLQLLAWTGMRRQEAAELFVMDLVEEPEGLLLTLRRKGDKVGVVLAPAGLETMLRDYVEVLDLEGPLFPTMRRLPRGEIIIGHTAIVPDTITHIIRDMTHAALGTAYGPHRLRHFFANAVWDKGGTVESIQQYLGHEDPKTTRGYLALKPRRDRSAAELIELD
jgi:site-specific recombinase XerD